MKKVCLLSNCQGQSIWMALLAHPSISSQYEARHFENYIHHDNREVINFVKEADVILYQPLKDGTNGSFSTREMLTHVKDGATTISFPYIYCNPTVLR